MDDLFVLQPFEIVLWDFLKQLLEGLQSGSYEIDLRDLVLEEICEIMSQLSFSECRGTHRCIAQ